MKSVMSTYEVQKFYAKISPNSMKIAVDGPSGSGKSTISKAIAKGLNLNYLDTGAMYRAITAWALNGESNLPIDWDKKLTNFPHIEIKTDPDSFSISINNQDLTQEIRSQRITNQVSQVSANKVVREFLVQLQREIMARADGIVMEGRDIGTVVMPDAEVKIFLVADLTKRAQRRAEEMNLDPNLIENSLIERDTKDSGRKISPLVKADDAIELDTTDLSIEESIKQALSIIEKRKK